MQSSKSLTGFDGVNECKTATSITYERIGYINIPQTQFIKLGLLIITILLLHISSIYIFASGFLLTRVELDDHNNCSTFESLFLLNNDHGISCWTKPRYGRAVILIIDALRHDFIVWNSTYDNHHHVPYHINKLPSIHNMLITNPQHGLVYRFLADPPTTTLQRLKALTTGTLPTFVDAGSNFGSSAVTEDNILAQFTTNLRKRIDFVGDDTWQAVYGHLLSNSHPYPSLDVWDLHTVDNGCIKHLFPALQKVNESNKNETGWDVYIAHFLGVDHAGHRYGPDHIAMSDKLTQLNGIIERVMQLLDDDTLLIVLGDHGMDSKGDHGGESELEISAALFLYSKSKPLYTSQYGDIEKLIQVRKEVEGEFDNHYATTEYNSISQIDLVPTLSLLFGLPVPFGNLGSIIPELLYTGDKPLLNVVQGIRLNALQVHQYVNAYALTRAGASLCVSELEQLFEIAENEYQNLVQNSSISQDDVDDNWKQSNGQNMASFDQKSQKQASSNPPNINYDPDVLVSIYQKYLKFTRTALFAAKKIWARFDIPMIILGLVLFAITVISTALYALIGAGHEQSIPYIFMVTGLITGIALGVSRVLSMVISMIDSYDDSSMTLYHEVIFMGSIGCLLPFSFWLMSKVSLKRFSFQWPTVVGVILATLYIISLGSDSYTVWEDSTTLYLVQTGWIVSLASALAIRNSSVAQYRLIVIAMSCIILNRISATSTLCREEQVPKCVSTFYSSPESSVSPLSSTLGLLVIALVVPYIIKWAADDTDATYATIELIISYFLPMTMIVSAIYWVLDYADVQLYFVGSSVVTLLAGHSIKVWWAKLCFTSLTFALSYLWYSDPRSVELEVMHAPEDITGVVGAKVLKIKGINNAVGGSVIGLLGIWGAIVGFVIKPTGGIMLGLMTIEMVGLAETCALWRDDVNEGDSEIKEENIRKTRPNHQKTDYSLLFLVLLFLQTHRTFFATGHQNTFASIDWTAAFIGIEAANPISASLLVGLNTFGVTIIGAIGSILLPTWRKTLLPGSETEFMKSVSKSIIGWITLESLLVFSSSAFAGLHRRHLMVWRVWAPRFVFGGIWLVIVDVAALLFGVLAVYRASNAWGMILKRMKFLKD